MARCAHRTARQACVRCTQVVPFLRKCTDIVYHDVARSNGEGYSTRKLTHVLVSLGRLGVPFEAVFPLVQQVAACLKARVETMGVTCATLAPLNPKSLATDTLQCSEATTWRALQGCVFSSGRAAEAGRADARGDAAAARGHGAPQ